LARYGHGNSLRGLRSPLKGNARFTPSGVRGQATSLRDDFACNGDHYGQFLPQLVTYRIVRQETNWGQTTTRTAYAASPRQTVVCPLISSYPLITPQR